MKFKNIKVGERYYVKWWSQAKDIIFAEVVQKVNRKKAILKRLYDGRLETHAIKNIVAPLIEKQGAGDG